MRTRLIAFAALVSLALPAAAEWNERYDPVRVASLAGARGLPRELLAQVIYLPPGGSSSVTITAGSTAISGCGAGQVLFEAATPVLGCDADFTYASDVLTLGSAGVGTNATVWRKTMSGSSATSNFFSVAGTFPGTLSATAQGVLFDFTGDNDAQTQSGLAIEFTGAGANGNHSGLSVTVDGTGGVNGWNTAGSFVNNSTSTGGAATVASGLIAQGAAASASSNLSTGAIAYLNTAGSTTMKGVGLEAFHTATGTTAAAESVGVRGMAWASAVVGNGGWFGPDSSASLLPQNRSNRPAVTGTVALVADNQDTTWQILCARDNSADVWCVNDGGNAVQTGANGATRVNGVISENITLNTGGTTTNSSANLLPANSIIESVVCRVTTTITTATDWSVGDSTTAARFISATATLTAGTQAVGLNHQQGSVSTDATGPVQVSATTLRITTTGTPGAGAIRCTTFYTQFTAPTS